MKHTVYYIDDQPHPQTVEANTSKMAAWKFLAAHPRTDASQITVESHSDVPWRKGASITHYRACDLVNTSAPMDEITPDLAVRIETGRERGYVVSGSVESLQTLGNGLLRGLEKWVTDDSPVKGNFACSLLLITGEDYIAFEVEPDVGKYWPRGPRPPFSRFLVKMAVLILALIGLWTVVRWLS